MTTILSHSNFFMLHLCQLWFSKPLIEWYLTHWLFLEQGGTCWKYGTHKWYATRKSLGTTALGAPHYKAHFRFLRKLKAFKCAFWSEKHGSCPDLFAGNHLLTAHAKTCVKCYVLERFMRTIVEWCGYCAFAHY